MTARLATHWDAAYQNRAPHEVTWFEPAPAVSLEAMGLTRPAAGAERAPRVLDVGGGASRLVDACLDAGLPRPAVLDISAVALAHSKERLGARAADVDWHCGDLFDRAEDVGPVDIWHDRAVFHFLTAAEDQARYAALAARVVKPGGRVVLTTFAKAGPTRCSGLQTAQHDAASVTALFGQAFGLRTAMRHVHPAPAGFHQAFCTFVLVRREDAAA